MTWPSLRELRELNAVSSELSNSIRPASAGLRNAEDVDDGVSSAVLAALSASSHVLFTTQAEIAGISLAIADYLTWIRQMPQPSPNLIHIAQTLEARAREVHEMAKTQHWAAWRSMVASLESQKGLCLGLRRLEEQLSRRTNEIERFFDDNYSVSQPVSRQRSPDAFSVNNSGLITPASSSSAHEFQRTGN
ncbi:hypothetical protein KJ359_010603 [Pestalotiopsis sp. 9143b]|nr:hypothetical protein KJ359_010603 [Pestalotiopsis sp. 9143b]